MTLNYATYVNEKFVAEITLNLTEVISRNKEVLKKSGLSDEEVGRIMLNMAAEVRVLEEQWSRQLKDMLQTRPWPLSPQPDSRNMAAK